MRLIDADKVPEAFNYEDGSWWFQDRIDELPTVDAKPVVHAKWIREDVEGLGWHRICSNCRNNILFNYYGNDVFSKYCPHCGAKMDL